MKFKGTVLMAAAFLSLVGYYFFIDLPAEQKQKDQEAFDEKVLPLKLKQVTEVSIIQADTTITVKRSTANNWDLTYPISAPGDTAEIESFISGVGSLLKTRVVEKAPEDLSIYGLNTPSLKIYFKTQRSQEETLLVGDESPLGGSLYLKRKNQNPVVIAAVSQIQFEKSVYNFRDKNLIRFSAGNIKQIKISRENNPIQLQKMEGEWKLTGKTTIQADKDAVMNFLRSIQLTRVIEFVDENPDSLKRYGLDTPRLKLVLETADGETQKISIGQPKEDKGYYCRINDEKNIVLISTKLFNNISKNSVEFLDKTLIHFDEKEVQEFSLRSGNETIRLIRQGDDKWNIASPIKSKVNLATINSLFFDLKEARISEFVKISLDISEAFGLKTPKKSFIQKTKDGSQTILQFGNQTSDGKKVFAKRKGEPTVFLISQSVVDKLFRSLHDLRNRKLLQIENKELQRITIKTPKNYFELKKTGEEWNLKKPEKIKTKHIGHDLVWTLESLEFDSLIIPPLSSDLAGLDPPSYTISLWKSANEKLSSFEAGKYLEQELLHIVQINGQQYRVKNKFLNTIPLTIDEFRP